MLVVVVRRFRIDAICYTVYLYVTIKMCSKKEHSMTLKKETLTIPKEKIQKSRFCPKEIIKATFRKMWFKWVSFLFFRTTMYQKPHLVTVVLINSHNMYISQSTVGHEFISVATSLPSHQQYFRHIATLKTWKDRAKTSNFAHLRPSFFSFSF